jgi:hypothetical protein
MNNALVQMNSQVTKQDVDKWAEDLLDRILLRTMTNHDVINQDGTVASTWTGEEL